MTTRHTMSSTQERDSCRIRHDHRDLSHAGSILDAPLRVIVAGLDAVQTVPEVGTARASVGAPWYLLTEDQCTHELDRRRTVGEHLVVVATQGEFIVPHLLDRAAHFDVLLVADEVG